MVTSSPFRVRHRTDIRRMTDLVEPMDRALRSTRVLVRQTAVAAYHAVRSRSPTRCWRWTSRTRPTWWPTSSRPTAWPSGRGTPLLAIGEASGLVERSDELAAEVVLVQLRSVVVDLLLLTGMTQIESTEALPPPPR